MSALNFPSSPTSGQQYTGDNGITYTYDGTKWIGSSPTLPAGTNSLINNGHVIQVTSSGNLVIPNGASILYQNGSPVTTGGGGGSTSTLVNGSYTVSIGDDGKFQTNNDTITSVDLRDTSGRGFYTDNTGFTLRSNGSNNWIFDTSGQLTIPSGGRISSVINHGVNLISYSEVSNDTELNLNTDSIDLYSWNDNFDVGAELYIDTSNTSSPYAYIGVQPGSGMSELIWNFDAEGKLSVPGNIKFSNLTLIDSTATNTVFKTMNSFIIETDKPANQYAPQWTFDNSGVLTMPGTIYANSTATISVGTTKEAWCNFLVSQQGSTATFLVQDVQFDQSGNVFATLINTNTTTNIIMVVKYDTSGNVLWGQQITGSAVSPVTFGLAVDLQSNLYITLTDLQSGSQVTTIAKLSGTTGGVVWATSLTDVGDIGFNAVMGTDAELIVNGIYNNNGNSNIFLMKFNPDNGGVIWQKQLVDIGYSDYDTGLAVDPGTGDIAISGTAENGGFIIITDTNGTFSRGVALNITTGSNVLQISDSVFDSHSNLYITGGLSTGNGSVVGGFIAKIDTSSNLAWCYQIGEGNTCIDITTSLVVDENNNVYVIGSTLTPGGDGYPVTSLGSFTPDGTERWQYWINTPAGVTFPGGFSTELFLESFVGLGNNISYRNGLLAIGVLATTGSYYYPYVMAVPSDGTQFFFDGDMLPIFSTASTWSAIPATPIVNTFTSVLSAGTMTIVTDVSLSSNSIEIGPSEGGTYDFTTSTSYLSQESWKFKPDGGLQFPDGTTQYTAWTTATQWTATPASGSCPINVQLTPDYFSAYMQNSHLELDNGGNWNIGSSYLGTLLVAEGSTATLISNDGSIVVRTGYTNEVTFNNNGSLTFSNTATIRDTHGNVITQSYFNGQSYLPNIAIGPHAGSNPADGNTIAIGYEAGQGPQEGHAIAIGARAGKNGQGFGAIAIGANAAGQIGGPAAAQSTGSIVILADGGNYYNNLTDAGPNTLVIKPIRNDGTPADVLFYNTTSGEITYGTAPVGGFSTTSTLVNGSYSFALGADGTLAFSNTATIQDPNGNVITQAYWYGNTNEPNIAIGPQAGANPQGGNMIAIGYEAGKGYQDNYAIALGARAGKFGQGQGAIAIGAFAAGQWGTSGSAQSANSIIINATGNQSTPLYDAGAGTFVVKPIRNDGTPADILYYNPTSGEISYGSAPSLNELVNGSYSVSLDSSGILTLSTASVILGIGTDPNVYIETINGEITNTWAFTSTGRFEVPGQIDISSTDTTDSGSGYAGFIKLTNSNTSATNINKSIRLSDAGNLQIVNSAYSETIFDLADNGNVTLSGAVINSSENATGSGDPAYPTAIDLTKTVNKLGDNTGSYYTLADGVEGQIMYLVKQHTVTDFTYSSIHVTVANAYYGINQLTSQNLYFGSGQDLITLLFTDGAWQQSGGTWD